MYVRLLLSLVGVAALGVVLHAIYAALGIPGSAALAVLSALVFSVILAAILSRPLSRARRFATQLTHGEAPARLPETASGEAGDLYAALNRLAETHRSRMAEFKAKKLETDVLLREMGEGVLALNSNGTVARANAELRSLIGATDAIAGRAVGTLFRNPQLVQFLEPRTVPEEGVQREFEVFGRTMLVTARRLPAAGVVAVFSDLTELRRLDAIRTEFVANASHELKTPLTAIRGFAETLLDPAVPEADRQGFAHRIMDHAERMNAIVDDLLTLARLEEPGREIRREPLDLRSLAERILDGFNVRADAAGIATSLEVEPDDLTVLADPEGVRQILENLIDNAIRHANARRIVVAARAGDAQEVEVSVEDDGQGIPAVHVERVFERFYRVDPSRSRATGGTGLGLAIVRHWTEVMGGRVNAESSLGQGTRMSVRLPAVPSNSSSRPK